MIRKVAFLGAALLAMAAQPDLSFAVERDRNGDRNHEIEFINVRSLGKNRDCVISLEKIGPRQIKVGSFFDYYIRIENRSDCRIRDLELTDILPERTQFESASPRPDREDIPTPPFGGELEWRNISLSPYEIEIVHVRVHAVGPPDRTLVNKACLEFEGRGGEDRVCVRARTEVVTGGETNGGSNGGANGPSAGAGAY